MTSDYNSAAYASPAILGSGPPYPHGLGGNTWNYESRGGKRRAVRKSKRRYRTRRGKTRRIR
jgi:hypothetical protein